ncbi:MAG: sigma-70 family RNA polymerase sigma factor [Prevotella sp.]|nr:sigma-70 family RNA polymerase sigma factor [Prevotella sp.]
METEQQLLLAIGNGDREALRRFYERYAGYATAIALRYIPQREQMADVLQDSFVKMLTSIQQFQYRGEGSLRGWVARIVANEAVDHLKDKARLTLTEELPKIPVQEEWSNGGEEDIDNVTPEELTRLIGQLPDKYRLVLNLFVFEQLPHREIASRLGIKESTSASLFFRAKRQLAKLIREHLNKQKG